MPAILELFTVLPGSGVEPYGERPQVVYGGSIIWGGSISGVRGMFRRETSTTLGLIRKGCFGPWPAVLEHRRTRSTRSLGPDTPNQRAATYRAFSISLEARIEPS